MHMGLGKQTAATAGGALAALAVVLPANQFGASMRASNESSFSPVCDHGARVWLFTPPNSELPGMTTVETELCPRVRRTEGQRPIPAQARKPYVVEARYCIAHDALRMGDAVADLTGLPAKPDPS